ncbi:hypothetical protein BDZ89DRAFT_1060731 [Hymenopellis radicata]|nr:hypothetical protein BDZ89DRAFT_1078345 [Hymenopellis radicata]KAF9040302.1 hypothetical protein BDZ89DRAFT_1060731 [Hymenopellis radicata]
MQFNVLFTLAVVVFGSVSASPVANTNAERLARGLPLKPPTMRRHLAVIRSQPSVVPKS